MVTIIEPASQWPTLGLRDLWAYRNLVFHLTLRNVKVRYKQTVLGALWAILQPALMMVVFGLTVNRWVPRASGELPYWVFVFSGLLPWMFFQNAVSAAANSVVGAEMLVTKVYFPRLAIPLAAVLAALVDFAIAFVVLVVLMACYGIPPTFRILLVPLAIVLLVLASTGVGAWAAAATVSYRDVRHAVPFLLQAWLIATPTIYLAPERQAEVAPVRTTAASPQSTDQATAEKQAGDMTGAGQTPAGPATYQGTGWLRWLARLNPLTGPIDFFRAAMLGRPIPWLGLVATCLVHTVLCLGGLFYFRWVEDSFADVI